MFNLDVSSTYLWPVKFKLPTNGGKFTEQNFDGQFKRLDQTRINELREGIAKGEVEDIDIAKEVLQGWEGVTAGTEPVPYTEATRDRLLNVPGVATAVVTALTESLAGGAQKN